MIYTWQTRKSFKRKFISIYVWLKPSVLPFTTYLTEVRFVTEQVVLNSDDLALPVKRFWIIIVIKANKNRINLANTLNLYDYINNNNYLSMSKWFKYFM